MASLITVVVCMEGTIFGKNLTFTYAKFSEVKNFGDGRWYNCNDSSVSKMSTPDMSSSSAYVLFYVMED